MAVMKGVSIIFRHALESTSLKGIPRVLKTKETFLRGLWITFILMFFAFVVHQVMLILEEYFSYPTVTTLSEERPSLDFPAITLCNLKPLHLKDNSTTYNMEDYLNEVEANMTEWRQGRNNITANERATLSQLRFISAYYGYIGNERAEEYGMQQDDFILDCTFRSEVGDIRFNCSDVGTIESVLSPKYFNCYKITVAEENLDRIYPTALTLVLFLNNRNHYISEYYNTESDDLEEAGVKMVLNSRHDIIDLTRHGISLPPGYLSNIKMEMVKISRLSKPYGDCISNTQQLLHDLKGRPMHYSQDGCYSACIQQNISRICKCLNVKTKALFNESDRSLPFCSGPQGNFSKRMDTYTCSLDIEENSAFSCRFECQIQCDQFLVHSSTTLSNWPLPTKQLAFYDNYIKGRSFAPLFHELQRIKDQYDSNKNAKEALRELRKLSDIQENFMRVEIREKQVFMTTIEQKVKVTIPDVVSKVGSLMNLYSGITLIVVVEILDLFYCLVCYFCRKNKEEKKNGMPDNNNKDVNGFKTTGV